MKFYINPHTLKIEPIPYDYSYPKYFFNSYKVNSENELLNNFQEIN